MTYANEANATLMSNVLAVALLVLGALPMIALTMAGTPL
jgi:hypothetical protein